jgi:hypothetical protein
MTGDAYQYAALSGTMQELGVMPVKRTAAGIPVTTDSNEKLDSVLTHAIQGCRNYVHSIYIHSKVR